MEVMAVGGARAPPPPPPHRYIRRYVCPSVSYHVVQSRDRLESLDILGVDWCMK
jgi:hypothetical protein